MPLLNNTETVELRWPRRSPFQDRDLEVVYKGPATFDVPEEKEEKYLGRGWEHPGDFDADELLDRDHSQVLRRIRGGRVDDKLDEVREAAEVSGTLPRDVRRESQEILEALDEREDERSDKLGQTEELRTTPYR